MHAGGKAKTQFLTLIIITMKKKLLFFATLLCAFTLQAKTVYLNTGGAGLWDQAGAKFAVWHWQGSNAGAWTPFMTKVEGNVYKVDIADTSDKVIFVRCNSTATAPGWDNSI